MSTQRSIYMYHGVYSERSPVTASGRPINVSHRTARLQAHRKLKSEIGDRRPTNNLVFHDALLIAIAHHLDHYLIFHRTNHLHGPLNDLLTLGAYIDNSGRLALLTELAVPSAQSGKGE